MATKTDIWMPLYIGDYLADTTRLSTEQHGAYLLLLMDYWRSGPPPNDDLVLSQITKLSPDAWSNAKAMLMQFFSIENNFLVHKRVDTEIEKAITNKSKNSTRAHNAAIARWSKQNKDAPSNAQAMLEPCPSPSPSPSLKTNKNISPPNGVAINLWNDFVILRRAKKLPITETAIRGLVREGNKANMSLPDVIRTCCERGWAGFKAEWVLDKTSAHERNMKTLAELTGGIHGEDFSFKPITHNTMPNTIDEELNDRLL